MTLKSFVKTKQFLFWDAKDPARLSAPAVLQSVLNFGDFDDVKKVCQIIGREKAAEIFNKQIKSKRSNYRPEIKNYFQLYFKKYARGNSVR
ncbi:MAG: hypothetical protein PHD72_02670 [Patescibacteria group bacterium]|nr:hypothetical protein [Patescibacteria group bacterium]